MGPTPQGVEKLHNLESQCGSVPVSLCDQVLHCAEDQQLRAGGESSSVSGEMVLSL